MRDVYPELPSLPQTSLVPVELQPEYVEPDGIDIGAAPNVATALLGGKPARAPALVHHEAGRTVTFGELADASARLANALDAHGLRMGDRLAIRSTNRPEAVVAALAAWRVGAIVVPTPPTARATELEFLLQDTGARALVACGAPATFEDVPAALEASDVAIRVVFEPGDETEGWLRWDDVLGAASSFRSDATLPENLPALIWHTGGTTGVPKACYHTHRRYLIAGRTFGEALGVTPGERWAAAAPVGHALGFLCHSSFTLLHGAAAVMVEAFAKPDAMLEAIAAHDVDTFVAITASWARMLEVLEAEPTLDRIGTLRRGYAMWQSASSGGVYDAWKARGIELLNNFGSTAFANWILVPRPGETVPRASLGRATRGYEVHAVDPDGGSLEPLPAGAMGRMAVKGPSALTYWNRPAEQERDVVDGSTLVDDLICFDDNGYADYLGRTDFVISSAGFKIAPIEVESVLCRHPAVAEAGVIGSPDAIRQEIVTAFVVLADPSSAGDDVRKELQDYVKSNLSPYKYPRRVEFVDALPRDHVGKVLPRILKQWAEERAQLPT
jgi:2-aminobenzoate-CoA ligase